MTPTHCRLILTEADSLLNIRFSEHVSTLGFLVQPLSHLTNVPLLRSLNPFRPADQSLTVNELSIQELGIPHAWASFIWLCGPISGLVVQPCIGIWSDNCTHKWGRRRPFILWGAVLVAVAVSAALILFGSSCFEHSTVGLRRPRCNLRRSGTVISRIVKAQKNISASLCRQELVVSSDDTERVLHRWCGRSVKAELFNCSCGTWSAERKTWARCLKSMDNGTHSLSIFVLAHRTNFYFFNKWFSFNRFTCHESSINQSAARAGEIFLSWPK